MEGSSRFNGTSRERLELRSPEGSRTDSPRPNDNHPWIQKKPHSLRRQASFNTANEREMQMRMLAHRNDQEVMEREYLSRKDRRIALENARVRTLNQLQGREPMPQGFMERYEYKLNK